jgi:hypothetical protein
LEDKEVLLVVLIGINGVSRIDFDAIGSSSALIGIFLLNRIDNGD